MTEEDIKFVYTLSSRANMVADTIVSISTLKNYIDEENIVIFYTPPYDEDDEKRLRETGAEIVKKDNETESFSMFGSDEAGHYGEKIKITQLDCDTLVFLDCDTVILNDIWPVIEGEFDIKARPGSTGEEDEEWKKLFERFNEEYLDFMPNTGFLIFKNRVHKEIGQKWLDYVNTDLEYSREVNHHEQYALALAAGERDWQKMTPKEHAFGWNEKPSSETVVFHEGNPPEFSILKNAKNKFKEVVREIWA